MFFNFTHSREPIPFPRQPGTRDPAGVTFSEEEFHRILSRERKRLQRSQQPFILMLVSLSRLPAGGNGRSPRSRAISALASTIRDVDLMGWHQSGSVMGIIFTEVGNSRPAPALKRIHSALAAELDAEELSKVRISVQYFSEAILRPASAAKNEMAASE